MSITINLDNLSKFNKRAHDQLKSIDPDIKLSKASEIFARIMGFNDVHHAQKAFAGEPTQEPTEEFIGSNQVNNVINTNVTAKEEIDNFFSAWDIKQVRMIIETDNLIKINLHENIWVNLRFGKHKFIKPTHLDVVSHIEKTLWSEYLSDKRINDVMEKLDTVVKIDNITNLKATQYSLGDFAYFVNKIKEMEKEKFVTSPYYNENNRTHISVSTNDHIFYTDKNSNDLKLGINRLGIKRVEKIIPAYYDDKRSTFEGIAEDNYNDKKSDTVEIGPINWYNIDIPSTVISGTAYRRVRQMEKIEYVSHEQDPSYPWGYFDIRVMEMETFDPIDEIYDKWLVKV